LAAAATFPGVTPRVRAKAANAKNSLVFIEMLLLLDERESPLALLEVPQTLSTASLAAFDAERRPHVGSEDTQERR
jgi:hypothetical protein